MYSNNSYAFEFKDLSVYLGQLISVDNFSIVPFSLQFSPFLDKKNLCYYSTELYLYLNCTADGVPTVGRWFAVTSVQTPSVNSAYRGTWAEQSSSR